MNEKPFSKNPPVLDKTQNQFQLSNYSKDLLGGCRTVKVQFLISSEKSITTIIMGCKNIRLCLNIKYAYLSTDILYEILLSLQLLIGHNFYKLMRHLIMILE